MTVKSEPWNECTLECSLLVLLEQPRMKVPRCDTKGTYIPNCFIGIFIFKQALINELTNRSAIKIPTSNLTGIIWFL